MSGPASGRRIVVATAETLAVRMAGPAIRAWQVATALGREHEVRLVTTGRCDLTPPASFSVAAVGDRGLREAEQWCDVLVYQGPAMEGSRELHGSERVHVVDMYDPYHLEQLEQSRDLYPEEREHRTRAGVTMVDEQLRRGDFFLCASEKQRDFWLGHLAALGRVNTVSYDHDATLRSLIAVVPFGIPEEPPVKTRSAVRGVMPGIGPDDDLLLWGGGVYNWFDPLTLLQALDRLRLRRPQVRLLFMGMRHPNPGVPEMRMARDARALAGKLGLTGKHVFFNEEWVAYDDRQNFLLEADVGVSTHIDHVETAYSYRTRVLDYVWAGLPVVATAGDSLSGMVEARGLGLTVPPGDVEALGDALFRLLDDKVLATACRERARDVARDLAWEQVLEPLIEFCRTPRRAPDLLDPATAASMRETFAGAPRDSRAGATGWRRDVRLAISHLRNGGPRQMVARARGRVRRNRWARR
jgi:glycosyltransferase involved in cell wall biosynthesis